MEETYDTYPKLLLRNYYKWGDSRVAMRRKDFGIWEEFTWKDLYEKVKYFSLGLISLGLEVGEKVAIVGENDPEWFWAELAAQAANGVSVGLWGDALPEELKYLLGLSETNFAVAQDQEQVDKLLEIRGELPLVRKIIYWDPKGMKRYDDPIIMSYNEVIRLGQEYEKSHPGLFEENVARGKADDMSIIMWTSGTTKLPKGAMITYKHYFNLALQWLAFHPAYESDEYVSCTLPGWGTEQILGLTYLLMKGQKMNFPEEPETVEADLREISPHVLLYPSRLWERVASTIQTNIMDSTWLKKFIYHLFLPIGYKVGELAVGGGKANLFWRSLRAVAELALFRPLRDRHGFARARVTHTGGALLGPDILRFLQAVGINLRQSYGITEVGMVSTHPADDIKFESVGKLSHGMLIRISEEGEVLAPKENCFPGYYRNPEATEKAFREGWYHTGDAGYIDEDGHVIFIDRLEDMRQLADGTRFSPQYIESRLKFSPYIRDVIALGGEQREFVGAIVNIDFQTVSDWAERKRLPYTTFVDLSQKAEVGELIAKEVGKVNRTLPPDSRVKGFVNLHKEFDPDEAELTRTRKLRRAFVEERYKELVEAVYGEKEEVTVEAPVVYKDGRKGVVSSKIRVMQVT